MDIRQDIRPVSDLSTHTVELMDQVNEGRRPIYLTQDGRTRGVLIDPETFEDTKQALNMLKMLAQSEEDFDHGRHRSQEQVFARIEEKLKGKQREVSRPLFR